MEGLIKKCLKNRCLTSESGVTLLEMVAALSLTAFLLGILSQLLFGGIRLWSKQDRAYLQQHRFKFIYTTLYNDFGTILANEYLPEPAVEGDDLKVKFWSESAKGLVMVTYTYDEKENTVSRWEGFYGQEEEAGIPLFKDILSWKVEYYKAEWKRWANEWDPEQKREVPAMIRVTVNTKSGNFGTMTFPVKAWRKKDENR